MLCQTLRITNPRCQGRRICILRCLHDTDNFQGFPVINQLFHIIRIIGFVLPDLILAVIFVAIRYVDQLEGLS